MIPINSQIVDPNLLMQQNVAGNQSGIWTALPGIIQKFDPETLTCDVQPAIMGRVRQIDGTIQQVQLPMLLDCPVVFPHAGGASLTFPIKQGDECLVVFSSRGIDFWWQQGGIQPPPEPRMHDLSDGFVIPGVWSQPEKIGNVSTESVQLRSDDGQSFIEINPTSHDINAKTTANLTTTVGGNATVTVTGNAVLKAASVTIDAPQTNVTGNLTVTGLITGNQGITTSGGNGVQVTGNVSVNGDVTADGISLKSHTHSGVQPGDGNTGAPQ
jgi:phage baseplate assembly protein V